MRSWGNSPSVTGSVRRCACAYRASTLRQRGRGATAQASQAACGGARVLTERRHCGSVVVGQQPKRHRQRAEVRVCLQSVDTAAAWSWGNSPSVTGSVLRCACACIASTLRQRGRSAIAEEKKNNGLEIKICLKQKEAKFENCIVLMLR